MSEKDFSAGGDRAPADSDVLSKHEGDDETDQSSVTPRMTREKDSPLPASEVPVGPRGLAFDQARLAYSIINALLEHTRVTSDLIALMAQVIDEETTKALTRTPYWSAYLDSRRAMERTRQEIEEFAEVWTQLAREEKPPEA